VFTTSFNVTPKTIDISYNKTKATLLAYAITNRPTVTVISAGLLLKLTRQIGIALQHSPELIYGSGIAMLLLPCGRS